MDFVAAATETGIGAPPPPFAPFPPPPSDAPREQEVMAWVTGGLLNKQVAAEIGVTEITVKVHRGKVTRKMGAKSLADLVKMADLLGIRRTKT
jgi:DNA-binding NarL/FixJ family response regulator